MTYKKAQQVKQRAIKEYGVNANCLVIEHSPQRKDWKVWRYSDPNIARSIISILGARASLG